MKKILDWLMGDDEGAWGMIAAAIAGAIAGVLFANIRQINAMLEDIYILLHEQKRLSMAAAQRELAAAQRHERQAGSAPDA